MSDTMVRTPDLCNGGPSVEATLAHMQLSQAQMHQQMQHLLQLQMQQPQPQVWPQLPAQMSFPAFAAFSTAGSLPSVSQGARVVRPGRMGRRERTEMKATPSSKRGQASSSRRVKDIASPSGEDSWQMTGEPAEAKEAEGEGEQVGPNMPDLGSFSRKVKAEMENSCKVIQDCMAKTMQDMMTTCKQELAALADVVNSSMNLKWEAAVTEMKGQVEQILSQFDRKLVSAMAEMQNQMEPRTPDIERKIAAVTVGVNTEFGQKLHSIDRHVDAAQDMTQDLKDAIADSEQRLHFLSTTTQAMQAEVQEEVKELQASLKKANEQIAEMTVRMDMLRAAAVTVQVAQAGEAAEEEVAEEAQSESGASDTSSLDPQEPAQPPPSDALWIAIRGNKGCEALELLKLPQVPGLNDPKGSCSMLCWAIASDLQEVAVELLRRPDFLQVNEKHIDSGLTCLHRAALKGQLQVCKAILARDDFSEAQARITQGMPGSTRALCRGLPHNCPIGSTALDIARREGWQSIVEMLQLANW
ncbi:unnamed protein product [Polarella glacialis]|uniref:Uncharacterized protein n=1 Tax=Polarella glacialis TaxID=89957 RepID=A0A813L725_POLGL|nr:unnamed protein product [Polarella glacialis]